MNDNTLKQKMNIIETDDYWKTPLNESELACASELDALLCEKEIIRICNAIDTPKHINDVLIENLTLFDDATLRDWLRLHTGRLYAEDMSIGNSNSAFSHLKDRPHLDDTDTQHANLVYSYMFLLGYDKLRHAYESRNIPIENLHLGLRNIWIWTQDYYDKNQCWGLERLPWIANFYALKIFRIGRLELKIEEFKINAQAFLHTETQDIKLLANAGCLFDQEGQTYDSDDANEETWTSIRSDSHDSYSGNYIHPTGHADPKTMVLNKTEWECILNFNDPVLGIHIPADGPMTHHECGQAIQDACVFFTTYFPDKPFRTLTCQSWLMDHQLSHYLKPESNIVKFLQEFYLLPTPDSMDLEILDRVFGSTDVDIDSVSCTSSLQHAVVQHLAAGKKWRSATGLLFVDSMNWGKQIYRS